MNKLLDGDAMLGRAERQDVLCLSHLRWDFVFQRPQHLMTRCALGRRVFFCEEPTFGSPEACLTITEREQGVQVVVPSLPQAMRDDPAEQISTQQRLIADHLERHSATAPILWYYTPMALAFTLPLQATIVVYDCMDDLSGFAGANAALPFMERVLLREADLVLTGGASLYRAKRHLHRNVHCFPSAVELGRFSQAAKSNAPDPLDQAGVPHPRVGFMGVIDERLDLDLLSQAARARPHLQFVMIGPTAKIDPASLPRHPNIWYLGPKNYEELPQYVLHWDAAMAPFAHNRATKFISPTKILEYLAAARPVVSTSVPDVVDTYAELPNWVRIADGWQAFTAALDEALTDDFGPRRAALDTFLEGRDWDGTWQRIDGLLDTATVTKLSSGETDSSYRSERILTR